MVDTATVTLVTLVGAFEIEGRLVEDLKRLGVKGFTRGQVEGRGGYGHQMAGLVDAPNFRLEMLVKASVAQRILERIASKYGGQPIIAFHHPVEATPSEAFK